MTYMLKSDPDHPLNGASFELFQISWMGDRKSGTWMRDDKNGKRWGFEHPDSGEIVPIYNAGHGPAPMMGRVSSAFTIVVLDVEVEEDEEPPIAKSLLTGSPGVMGRPELTQNPKEE